MGISNDRKDESNDKDCWQSEESGIRPRGKHNSALNKICESNGIDYEQLWDEIFGYPEYRPTEHSYSLSILLEIMQWAHNLERNTDWQIADNYRIWEKLWFPNLTAP